MKKIYSANQCQYILKVLTDTDRTIKQSKVIKGGKLTQVQSLINEHHIKIEVIDSISNHRFIVAMIRLGEEKKVSLNSSHQLPKEFKATKFLTDTIDDFLTRIIDIEQTNLVEFNEQEMINFLDHTMTESIFQLSQLFDSYLLQTAY